MLTPSELDRYNRQIMIEDFGVSGQEKLKKARVFIAGAGGLGSPVAIYLAVAGVGRIRIADLDTVERSNLNRQILHLEENVGQKKVNSAFDKLRKQNPGLEIEIISEPIDSENATRLTEGCDLIVDALDNWPTRFILNKAAVDLDIPLVHGAVNGFEGRALTVIPGKSACLRCMHREAIPQEVFPVIGVTPGMIGSIQATEAIKALLGIGDLLTDRLLVYDGLAMKFSEFKVRRNPECGHCGGL